MTILLRIIGIIFNVILLLLGVRFFLRLFGANSQNIIVRTLYDWSGYFLIPFRGMFPVTTEAGAVIEWSTLAAMGLYALLFYLLFAIIRALMPHVEAEEEDEHVVTHRPHEQAKS